MYKFVNLALFAILLIGGSLPHCLVADELDDKLSGDPLWIALEVEWKSELRPVLRLLLCEVVDRPPLNPSIAFDKAREELAASIREFIKVSQGQIENDLSKKLEVLSSEARFDPEQLRAPLERLSKGLQELAVNSPRLEAQVRLVSAAESFTFLAESANKYKTPADYKSLLLELKTALIEYALAPRNDEKRAILGRLVDLLEAFAAADRSANIEDLLTALRKVCKRPNFWLFISGRLINELAESAIKPIAERQAVNECILGTSISGTADTFAKPSLYPTEASDRAELTVRLNGTVTSDTLGYHRPVQITSKGNSSFCAEKRIAISDACFIAGRASASATTDTTICSIEKVGRQCLSKAIERIAWNRAMQQKPEAEAIASERLERRVESGFDDRLDSAIVKARSFYEERIRAPLRKLGISPAQLGFSSTSEAIGIGATFAKPGSLGAPNAPPSKTPPEAAQYDLTLKIHDTLLKNISFANRVSPEALDRVVKEALSSLPGVADGSPMEAYDLQLFKSILDVLSRPDPDSFERLKERTPNSRKLELTSVSYEDGWIVINWRLRKVP